MELQGGESLAQGREKFLKAYNRLRAQGGGTISIYYHPAEFVHREFWDAVNFARGSNPPRERWREPPVKTEAEIEKGFGDFEQYVSFIKAQPGVRYVTASELSALYPDLSPPKNFSISELSALARSVQKEITFQKLDTVALAAADLFSLLTNAVTSYLEKRALPSAVQLLPLFGPTRPFTPATAKPRPTSIPWYAFAQMVRDVESYCRRHGRIPDEVWIGVESISPADYLATLAFVVEELARRDRQPDRVTLREGKLTAEKYVAEDSPKLWNWLIFPEGFHAPKIMELARLQAWTLKPALLRR